MKVHLTIEKVPKLSGSIAECTAYVINYRKLCFLLFGCLKVQER